MIFNNSGQPLSIRDFSIGKRTVTVR